MPRKRRAAAEAQEVSFRYVYKLFLQKELTYSARRHRNAPFSSTTPHDLLAADGIDRNSGRPPCDIFSVG
jgi:hypothetical protein